MSATTVSMSNWSRPQVGQAIRTGPRSRRCSALRISQATLTSSSAWKVERLIRMVSPTPSASNVPSPTDDFSEPDHFVPASVIPRWIGYGTFSASRRFEAIVFGTLVDLIETLKFSKSSDSISSTNSTPAWTSASTEFSTLQLVQMLGQRSGVDPDPHRHVRLGRPLGDLCDLLGAADVARVEADAVGAGVDRLQRERVVEVDVGDHRDRRLLDDRLQRLDVLVPRHGDADEVGSRVGHRADLLHRRLEVRGLGLAHRLHGDGRAAPDGDVAHEDLALRSHGHRVAVGPAGRLAARESGVCGASSRSERIAASVREPRKGRSMNRRLRSVAFAICLSAAAVLPAVASADTAQTREHAQTSRAVPALCTRCVAVQNGASAGLSTHPFKSPANGLVTSWSVRSGDTGAIYIASDPAPGEPDELPGRRHQPGRDRRHVFRRTPSIPRPPRCRSQTAIRSALQINPGHDIPDHFTGNNADVDAYASLHSPTAPRGRSPAYRATSCCCRRPSASATCRMCTS